MDPFTAVGLASTVLKATGLGEKIGSWIGGDSGGESAEKVLDIAQKVSGAKTPEEAAESVREQPGLAAEMKEKLLEHEREILEMHLADVQDARGMQVEALKSDDRFVGRFVLYFASFWSIVGASYMFAITFFPIPDSGVRFADTALGFILGTIIAQILNFFFGSSKGSADKTGIMKEQMLKFVKR